MSDFAVIISEKGKVITGTRKNMQTFPDAAVRVLDEKNIFPPNEKVIILGKDFDKDDCKRGAIAVYDLAGERLESIIYFDDILLLKKAIDEVFKEAVTDGN